MPLDYRLPKRPAIHLEVLPMPTLLTPPAPPALDILEEDLYWLIRDLALVFGWKVYRTYDSRRSPEGFPDVVLARAGEPPVFAELKREHGRTTPAQRAWGQVLAAAGARHVVWRPSDWPAIVAVLTAQEGKG